MNKTRAAAAVWAAAVMGAAFWAGGCAHQNAVQSQAPSAAPTVALKNETGFPLPPNSKLLAARSFSQSISAGQAKNSPLTAQSSGDYAGHETIAAAASTFNDLKNWLNELEKNPPAGYTYDARAASAAGSVRQTTLKDGIDFGVFRARESANPRTVLVMVMDPKAAKQKLAFIIQMANRYRSLPSALRGTIDEQVKNRTGVSIEQALQPESPVGVALSTLNEFQERDSRAVMIVDAQKQ
jgi:hypothetical protein